MGFAGEGSLGRRGRGKKDVAEWGSFVRHRFLVWNQWGPAPLHWRDDANPDAQVRAVGAVTCRTTSVVCGGQLVPLLSFGLKSVFV